MSFQHFTRWAYFTRFSNGVAALLGRGPLCTCCSLLQNPLSWGRYVWAPNRWSRRGGLNMRNWRLWVYGWEVNEETWFFGSMLILLEMTFFRWYFGDHIFFFGGGDIFEITVLYTFWGDLFLTCFWGHFCSPITWIYPPPPHPVGFCQFVFLKQFLFEVFLKYADVFQESRRTFYFC